MHCICIRQKSRLESCNHDQKITKSHSNLSKIKIFRCRILRMLETQVQIKIFQKFIHKITYIWFINLLMDSQTFHCLFHFIINYNKEQTLKYSQDSSLISRSLVSSLKFSVFLIFLWWIFHVPFFFSSSFHVLRGISVSVISEKNVKHTSNCSNSYVHMKHIILHCFQNSKKKQYENVLCQWTLISFWLN